MHEFYSKSSRLIQDMNDSRRLADQLFKTRVHKILKENEIALIKKSQIFFLATSDENGYPDCSVKGGNPGFIDVEKDNQISFYDYDGNGMYRSLGNILSNPNVALLFLDFEGDLRKLRINGEAELIIDNTQDKEHRIKILINIRDIFPNCPRYLPHIKLGDSSIYNPKPDYKPPSPDWKSKADLKEHLPFVNK